MQLNSLQKTVARHIYSLLSTMTDEQRTGAALALSTLIVLSEDGYLSCDEQAIGFHEYCYNILAGCSAGLRILKDDNVLTDEMEKTVFTHDPKTHLPEADLALSRLEALFRNIVLMTRSTPGGQSS